MKCILWALAACCIFVGGATVVSGSNRSSSRQSQNHPITLSQIVQRAKESGKKNVYLPAPIPFYAEVDSLDEALSQTTAVVATPIGKDGIFKVNEDGGLENIAASKGGDKVQSLRRVKSAIEQDMERLHGNSLTQLKASIKKK